MLVFAAFSHRTETPFHPLLKLVLLPSSYTFGRLPLLTPYLLASKCSQPDWTQADCMTFKVFMLNSVPSLRYVD